MDNQTEQKKIKLILDIEPMGYVRTTQTQKWVDKRYKKYQNWKDTIRLLWLSEILKAGYKTDTLKFSIIDSITFYVTVPVGEKLKGKKLEERLERVGKPHQMKPDIDNMVKAFMDAVMKEDSHVHTIGMTKKIWGIHGYIEVVIVID